MLLTDIWLLFEYWSENPPVNETLYAFVIGLSGQKKPSKKDRKSPSENSLTQEGDYNPNALRAMAGPVIPINSAPSYLQEHIRKLAMMESEKSNAG